MSGPPSAEPSATRGGTTVSSGAAARQRLLQLYAELMECPTTERSAALAEIRTEDPQLAGELESLFGGPDTLPSGAQLSRQLWSPGEEFDQTATFDDVVRARPQMHSAPSSAWPELSRYRLVDRLGRGGAGQVFLAVDRESGDQIALKLLRPELVDNVKSVLRFRREFRAVARLDHPNCIRVLDEGAEGEHRYYAMEYLAAGDLRALVGAEPATLLVALIQVAAALDYIHGQRIVHRDIKPANVLLARREPPLVKLADFGIALRQTADVTQLTGTGQVVGTVDYMSPEQVEGQPLDPRSDLYSLGCMMWQLFTGRLPFEGNTVKRLVGRVYGAATPLAELRPELPGALSELIARLLARSPEQRPQSALEVVQALARILSELDPQRASELMGELPTDRAAAFLYQSPMVGRATELDRIVSLALAAATGEADAVALALVCAPAGAGKTALLRQLAERSNGPELLRVSVDPDLARPLAPFPELAQLLRTADPHAEHDDPWVASTALGILEDDELRRARSRQLAWLSTRLRERMREHGQERGLIIALDDMHLASGSARELLAELARSLSDAGPRPLLLALVRDEAGDALIPEQLPEQLPHARIELAPLAEAEVTSMVTAMLGVGASELPEGLAELVHGESQGWPAIVRSYLDELLGRALLHRVPGGWALAPELGELRSARELLAARLEHLTPATREVLEVAAQVGSSFDTELLVRVLGSDTQVLDALDEALRASVIRSVAGANLDSFTFEHRRFVELLDAGLADARRPAIHGGIARVLSSRGAPASILVRHLELGDDDVAAHAALVAAAEQARRALDYEAAAGYLRRALERGQSGQVAAAELTELREQLAETAIVIGRASEAIPLLRHNLEHNREHLARARLQRQLGRALLLANETDAGREALSQALVELGDPPARTRVGTIWRIVRDFSATNLRRRLGLSSSPDATVIERALVHRELSLLYRYVDLERSAAHVMAYRRLAERSGDPALRIESLAWYAVALAFIGLTGSAAKVDATARHLAKRVQSREHLVRLELLRSGSLVLRGEFDEAFAELARSVEQARASGDRFLIGFATSIQGWWHGLWGRFDLALDDFVAARRLADEINLQWLQVDAGCGQCIALAVRGRFEESLAVSDEVIALGRKLHMPAVEAMAIEARAIVAFLRCDYRETHTLECTADRLYRSHNLQQSWGFSVQIFRYEALLLLEELEGPDAVPNLLSELRRCARSVRTSIGRLPLYRGYHELLLGVIAARQGRPRKAKRLFAAALDARASLPPNGWDIWIRMRVTVEGRRLGVHPDKVRAEFRATLVEAERWSGEGFITWLRNIAETLKL